MRYICKVVFSLERFWEPCVRGAEQAPCEVDGTPKKRDADSSGALPPKSYGKDSCHLSAMAPDCGPQSPRLDDVSSVMAKVRCMPVAVVEGGEGRGAVSATLSSGHRNRLVFGAAPGSHLYPECSSQGSPENVKQRMHLHTHQANKAVAHATAAQRITVLEQRPAQTVWGAAKGSAELQQHADPKRVTSRARHGLTSCL